MNSASAPRLLAQKATTLARQIMAASKISFQQAQSKAYYTLRLLSANQNGPVEFAYVKEDKTRRWATGERFAPDTDKPLIIRYYDTDAGGIRSFRVDRLIVN